MPDHPTNNKTSYLKFTRHGPKYIPVAAPKSRTISPPFPREHYECLGLGRTALTTMVNAELDAFIRDGALLRTSAFNQHLDRTVTSYAGQRHRLDTLHRAEAISLELLNQMGLLQHSTLKFLNRFRTHPKLSVLLQTEVTALSGVQIREMEQSGLRVAGVIDIAAARGLIRHTDRFAAFVAAPGAKLAATLSPRKSREDKPHA